jgi:hypothetical protein
MKLKLLKLVTFLPLLFSVLVGVSQMEHRITVLMNSEAYKNKTINIDSITHGAITANMFYSFKSRENWDAPVVKIIWKDSTVYAFEKCRFNVLTWQDSMWVNLYSNNNKGWCIENFYLQDNSILGFTAEGFWTSQAALYEFEKTTANWEIISTKNSPDYYASGGDFRIGEDTIISTWGTKTIQGKLEIIDVLSTYGLCLKTNTWFKVTNNIEFKTLASTAWGGITFDFENEVLIVRNNQIVQIDKKSRNVYLFKGDKLKHSQIDFYYNDCKSALIFQDGNYYSESPKPIEKLTPLGKISFESIHKKVEEESITASKKKSYLSYTIILIAMLLIGIIIWIVKFKKSKFNNQELLKEIKQQSGNLLNSDEIDVILGINSSMSQDSKRVKRSRIIKSINEEYVLKKGKKLITRQRDENDNRYMLYKIKK